MNLLSTFFGLGYPLVDSPKRHVKVVEGFLLMLLLPGYQFPLLRIGGLLTTRSLAAFPEDDAHTVAVAQKVFFSAQETVT